jgi:hypothetical protein
MENKLKSIKWESAIYYEITNTCVRTSKSLCIPNQFCMIHLNILGEDIF